MVEMTKKERIIAAARGESVDRVPASYYFHYHAAERSADLTVSYLVSN